GGQRCAAPAPFRLDVVFLFDVALAEVPEDGSIGELLEGRAGVAPRIGIHERHVLVREAGHGAGHADATDIGAAADPVHPTSNGHVALDHRALAAELDQAAVI